MRFQEELKYKLRNKLKDKHLDKLMPYYYKISKISIDVLIKNAYDDYKDKRRENQEITYIKYLLFSRARNKQKNIFAYFFFSARPLDCSDVEVDIPTFTEFVVNITPNKGEV